MKRYKALKDTYNGVKAETIGKLDYQYNLGKSTITGIYQFPVDKFAFVCIPKGNVENNPEWFEEISVWQRLGIAIEPIRTGDTVEVNLETGFIRSIRAH